MRDPAKGHAALRRGRCSIPHAEYFLTICTGERRAGLTIPVVAEAILFEIRAMEANGIWRLRCAVVMSDHVHLVTILGERLSLGKSIARLKSKTKAKLQAVNVALGWERDFYDHHVRPDEERLGLFLYVFLNPIGPASARAANLGRYFCREEDWAWF